MLLANLIGLYNIVLVTKGGFMHQRWLREYTDRMPASVLGHITKTVYADHRH